MNENIIHVPTSNAPPNTLLGTLDSIIQELTPLYTGNLKVKKGLGGYPEFLSEGEYLFVVEEKEGKYLGFLSKGDAVILTTDDPLKFLSSDTRGISVNVIDEKVTSIVTKSFEQFEQGQQYLVSIHHYREPKSLGKQFKNLTKQVLTYIIGTQNEIKNKVDYRLGFTLLGLEALSLINLNYRDLHPTEGLANAIIAVDFCIRSFIGYFGMSTKKRLGPIPFESSGVIGMLRGMRSYNK